MARVLVLGAGIGGLSAAIHARLKGHDVTVIEKSGSVGGKAVARVHKGYRLELGPSIVILVDIYRHIFQSAGRNPDDYLRFHQLDPVTRVYFQGREPFDIPAGREQALEELRSLFPVDAKSLDELFSSLDKAMPLIERTIFDHPLDQIWKFLNADLMKMGKWLPVRQKYKAFIDARFQSPILRAFLYGFPSYGGQSYHSVAPGALLIPYLMLNDGVWYPEGGIGAMPESLYRLAQDIGVQFLLEAEVQSFLIEGKRIAAVQTNQGSIPAEFVISNIDRITTENLLGRSQNPEPSYSYFTISIGIPKELEGLAHHNLFIPADFQAGFRQLYEANEPPRAPIIYLNAPSVTDDSSAPRGCSNLFVVVTVPSMRSSWTWKEIQAEYREKLLGEFEKYGIQLDPAEFEFEIVQTPETFATRDGNYLGSLYGPSQEERLFGMVPLRNYDERLANLAYCGASVQPGAGMPMAALSGKFATSRL
ncbi:MAG TPA: phytoene desaturase family protein [Fimbriimonadaceae bacterium]|nr:phytoene desaturase family protein [Fimbriimonadaceae bacterium]